MISNKISVKFFLFALVSGIGVTLDFICVWAGISIFALSPFISNCIGGAAGITFVFFTSSRKVFVNNGRLILVKFTAYLLYSAVLILCVSYIIQKFAFNGSIIKINDFLNLSFTHPALIVKFIITPFTLLVNFAVARWLIEKIKI